MQFYLRVLSLIICVVAPLLAHAGENDWIVKRAAGQANFTLDKSRWTAVKTGTAIPNKAWISTGPRGRLTLSRGVETISFQPNTLAAISTSGFLTRKTEIIQQIGTITLDIEKRNKPHTFVSTPFLAAVVKGTKFQVGVTKTKASVSVSRGLVEVRSFASGQQTHVGPGQSATVRTDMGMTVSGVDAAPSIVDVRPSVANIQAVDATSLDGQTSFARTRAQDKASAANKQTGNVGDNGNNGNGNNGNGNSGNGNSGKGNGNSAGNGNSGNGNNGKGNNGNGNSGNGNGNSAGNGNSGNGNSGSNGNGNSGGHSGNGNSGKGDSGKGGNGNNGNGNNGNGNGKNG